MADNNILSKTIYGIAKKLLSIPENRDTDIGSPKKILIIRQHNQLGDLLAGVSLFRALKETYPESKITLIVSPFNYPGLVKNKFIDRLFIFNKKKLFGLSYLKEFINLLREKYDVAIVPVVVSISFTSNLIARFANAKIRIGAKSLDGKPNYSDFLFDRRVVLDWRIHPDSNVSERSLDIVRPFGINTNNYKSEISFDNSDLNEAEKFIAKIELNEGEKLIGLHVGAGKPPNRWSLIKYISLIEILHNEFNARFYLTGSSSDMEEIDYITQNSPVSLPLFFNKTIPQVAALISKSDLFISNDTGIMHVAGTTKTPQISIFGPTNPFNWAPIGEKKYFIRRSEFIDEISVDDVYNICKMILEKEGKEGKSA